jgi:WD40 repeat protein
VNSWRPIWDIQAQKLDNKVGKRRGLPWLPHVPVFWTTKDRTIVAAFCFTDGDNDPAKTIYEFDSSTLETVGTSFEGHTGHVSGLALSNDSTLLASASFDSTIKLWAFESHQLIASFHDTAACHVVFSPDSHKLAYTTFGQGPHKIYICDIPPDILASVWPAQEAVKVCICPHTSTSLVLMSSYRPLNVNIHSPVINSMHVILFVHLSLPLILRLLGRCGSSSGCCIPSPTKTFPCNLPTAAHFHPPIAQTPSVIFSQESFSSPL